MIKIITDSTCSLTDEFIAARNITIVPLKVRFGEDEVYDELTGISNKEFYRRLSTGTVYPSTSQPAAGEFKTAFETLATAPDDELLVLTISSKLSGTFNSAQAATGLLPNVKVTLFDSRSLALGLGLMAAAASDMALAGKEMPAIMRRLAQMRRDMRIYFIVDTLEYLRRGGRIGPASALIGSVLNIKPILSISDGLIKPHDKVRTKRKAINHILHELRAGVPNPRDPVLIGVMHAAAELEMAPLEDAVRGLFDNVQRAIIGEIGPVLGTHAGPGLLGAGVCPMPPEDTL